MSSRAQKRLAERETRREATSRMFNEMGLNTLVGIGWFYKHDTEDGWGLFALEGMENWDGIKYIHDSCEKVYKNEMNAIEKQVNGYNISLEEFQKETKSNLKQYIKQFYILLGFKDGKQPLGQTIKWEMSGDISQLTTLICFQIFYLYKWGMIPDDTYNGMSYQYMNESILATQI